MKKILLCLLCVVAIVGCVSCGGGKNGSSKEAYVFKYNGASIAIDDELPVVLEAIGKYDRSETKPSCNHDGDAHFYYYGTKIELESYPKGGKDYLYKITLFDDTVKTVEGIRVGDEKDAVIRAYGEAENQEGSTLLYHAGNMYLKFFFSKNDTVSQIQYLHPDAIG